MNDFLSLKNNQSQVLLTGKHTGIKINHTKRSGTSNLKNRALWLAEFFVWPELSLTTYSILMIYYSLSSCKEIRKILNAFRLIRIKNQFNEESSFRAVWAQFGPNDESTQYGNIHHWLLYFNLYWRNQNKYWKVFKELSNSSWDIQFSEILPFLAKKG